jgi:hypothetical protein
MAPQRIILTKLFQGQPETASQLFSKAELASSSYEPGTQLVNHFEVLERSRGEVVVRAGERAARDAARAARDERRAGEFELSFVSAFLGAVHDVRDGRPSPTPPSCCTACTPAPSC